MGIKLIALVTSTLILSTSADAALIERLGGLAYYDDVAGLTWLTNANAGAGSVFDDGSSSTDGGMTWENANAWAASLNVDGVTGWRLANSDTCSGYGCTGSELGNMFYNVLGNTAGTLSNTGPFSSVSTVYWSATEYAPNPIESAWRFNMDIGHQNFSNKTFQNYSAWAVWSGDVNDFSAVPVPAAVWLFSSGLIGLIGVARRKKS